MAATTPGSTPGESTCDVPPPFDCWSVTSIALTIISRIPAGKSYHRARPPTHMSPYGSPLRGRDLIAQSRRLVKHFPSGVSCIAGSTLRITKVWPNGPNIIGLVFAPDCRFNFVIHIRLALHFCLARTSQSSRQRDLQMMSFHFGSAR